MHRGRSLDIFSKLSQPEIGEIFASLSTFYISLINTHKSQLNILHPLLYPALPLNKSRFKVLNILSGVVLEFEGELLPVRGVHPVRDAVLSRLVRNHAAGEVLAEGSLPLAGDPDLELPEGPVALPDDLLQVLHAQLHLVQPLGVGHRREGIFVRLLHGQQHVPLFQ